METPEKIAVIGTGRMGSALARALLDRGFSTMVWNRTPPKTEPLARLGIRVAPSLQAAAKGSGVVFVNVSDYNTTLQLLPAPEVASELSGKILVQLSSGTPQEARRMESWAKQHNYLSRRSCSKRSSGFRRHEHTGRGDKHVKARAVSIFRRQSFDHPVHLMEIPEIQKGLPSGIVTYVNCNRWHRIFLLRRQASTGNSG